MSGFQPATPPELDREDRELIPTLRGLRDMLRESAKQFRLNEDPGHATMCDAHADRADLLIKAL